MTDPIRKTYSCTVRAVDVDAGIYELMPSTESVDRDGDILLAAGARLDNYRKNPVVMFAHNYQDLPVAKALEIEAIPGEGLKAKIQFPPKGASQQADSVHALWAGGFLNAASVGFIPFKWEERDTDHEERDSFYPPRIYTSWELLEFSLVGIPSNASALRLAMKMLEVEEPEQPAPIQETPEPVTVKTATVVSVAKRGRVLSAKNEEKIRDARDNLDEVLKEVEDQPDESPREEAQDDIHPIWSVFPAKGAIASHETPKADPDTAWDGPAVVASLPNDREVLRRVHAWVDEKGDPDAKQSYKFPHHLADGRVVLRGVNNAMARLSQADIPAEDRAGVEAHLNRHQRQFEDEKSPTLLDADSERDLADSLQVLVHTLQEVYHE